MKPLANWSRPGTWPKYSTGLARGKTLSASKSKADCIPRSGDYAALELLRLPVPAVWSVQQIGGRWRIVFDRVSEESFVERMREDPTLVP
jgi:hypothetical protein